MSSPGRFCVGFIVPSQQWPKAASELLLLLGNALHGRSKERKLGVGGRLIDEHAPGGVMPLIGNDNVYIIYFLLPSARFIYRIT